MLVYGWCQLAEARVCQMLCRLWGQDGDVLLIWTLGSSARALIVLYCWTIKVCLFFFWFGTGYHFVRALKETCSEDLAGLEFWDLLPSACSDQKSIPCPAGPFRVVFEGGSESEGFPDPSLLCLLLYRKGGDFFHVNVAACQFSGSLSVLRVF